MPPRNLNVIIIAIGVALLCYFTNRSARTAMIVGDALQLIDTYYVDPIDEEELLIAAMDGMTSQLDEHSEYIPGADYESFQDSINQEFAGIGIFVEHTEEGQPVRVVTPLVDSPALEAGVLPGDLILQVDEEDVSAMDLAEVSSRLKGPIDTVVKILVGRGEQQVPLTVRRATIPLPSVIGDYRDEEDRWVYRLQDEPTIAYVRVTSFGEKTVKELSSVLAELNNDYRGLVLDLRGNGGGLLRAAVDVSDMFLEKGRIVSTRIRGGKIEDKFNASRGTLVDPSKPIAVIIDGDSASASEIVAACLQDHQRATIVGMRSYGKGTVQNILPLQYGRTALRLTVARYYRPNGNNIHRMKDASEEDEWGVSPDDGMKVELEESTIEALAKRWREASYPAMAKAEIDSASGGAGPAEAQDSNAELDPDSAPSDPPATDNAAPAEGGDDSTETSSSSTETDSGPDADQPPQTGLELDQQLKRAVEAILEAAAADRQVPKAA